MPDFNFTVAVGQTAPAGAEVNPLTNIRPRVPPAGRVKTQLIDRLTGAYSAIHTARNARTFFALVDSGILSKLDGLYIRGANQADSLLNWVNGRPAATNVGATFTAGLGFSLDGVDDYLDLNMSANRFTTTSASVFALAQSFAPVSSTPLIGRLTGGDYMRLYPYLFGAGEAGANGRLNSATSTSINPYIGPLSGLWGIGRLEGDQILTHDGDLLAQSAVAAVAMPSSITVGRNATVYGQAVVSAFGYGGYLAPADLAALRTILNAHHRVI